MPSLSGSNNVTITITTEANTAGVKQTQEALGQLEKQSESSAAKGGILSGAFSNLGSTLATLGSAFVGYQIIQKIQDFGTMAVSSAGELEQTNMSFQNLIGNTQQANKLFGELTQYANSTPFQVKDVTGAAKQLLAFGETASDTTTLVKQLGDVAAAGGGDLQAMSLVSGQVFAQGKMRAQDMYQVINDGGAGLIHIMAENAGGMQKLTAEFDKGGIPAKQYFDAINQATAKGGFAMDGAAHQAQTFNGRISTLKDSVANFGRELIGVHVSAEKGLEITPGGPFDKMSSAVQTIATRLQNLGPVAQKVFPEMEQFFRRVWEAADKLFGPSLEALWHTINDKLVPVFERWKPFLEFGVKVFAVELYAALWLFINTLNVAASVISFVGQVMANIGELFAWVWHRITDLWGGTPNFFSAVGHGIRDAFGSVASWLLSPFREAYDSIISLFSSLPGKLGGLVTNAMSNVTAPIKSGLHNLHVPGFASGVRNFGGGLAVVGENGPELTYLPPGSNVYSNSQSQQMVGSMGGSVNITIQNLSLPSVTDRTSFIAALDQDTILAGRGMTPNRGLR